jgi:hypothetical protein
VFEPGGLVIDCAIVPESVKAGTDRGAPRCGAKQNGKRKSVAEAGAYGYTLAADGATAAQYGRAALGLHARAEAMRLHSFAAIGLKCALGHESALLFPLEKSAPLRQVLSISQVESGIQPNVASGAKSVACVQDFGVCS